MPFLSYQDIYYAFKNDKVICDAVAQNTFVSLWLEIVGIIYLINRF